MDHKIIEITKSSPETQVEACIALLKEQMSFINARSDLKHVRKGVELGLENPNVCKVFAAINSDEKITAVAYGNIGCSLERAGYYLWINELFVEPEERNKGIATSLLKYIDKWCNENEIKGISLVAEVSNHTAKLLYEKLHFLAGEVLIFDKNL
ncbi:MAG: GNAT family N-acetyltransferase [Chitinophagales bacterium]|nr:GNAT family N-acetyltransferase [Chitinophagales bacterium]